jgi:hypothetical protein
MLAGFVDPGEEYAAPHKLRPDTFMTATSDP